MHNSWPLGKIPKQFQRPEPEQIRELGYQWNKPHEIVDMFEKEIAKYAGSKYAVAVDCDTNGIFLCLKYLARYTETITIPSHTYISVPNIIVTAGYRKINLEQKAWTGLYKIEPLNIYDSAGRFTRNMYVGGDNFQTLSFQIKKRLPIGRGGMILTDDKEAYDWLVKARYDGRDLDKPQTEDNIESFGYHMYMTPEDAARGLILFNELNIEHEDSHNWQSYKDLRENELFNIE
jgi:dTDP-4-amino-4,6-dideoxygalactose transaminase